MEEILKSSITTCVELHAVCLALVALFYYNMHRSYVRTNRQIGLSIRIVYFGSALMIISDCLWTVISSLESPGSIVSYAVNIIYFLSSSAAAAYWFFFCLNHLGKGLSKKKGLRVIVSIPYAIITFMYLLSPWFGFIFTIENSEYVRGTLFFLDPLIKLGYVVAASIFAFVSGSKKKIGYLRNEDFYFALFGLPIVICGFMQIILGIEINCLGVTVGLLLIYITGITNKDSENADAIFSLANSFEASYIVNMDTGLIRPLHHDSMHEKSIPGMESSEFNTHFYEVLSRILLPEDRISTLEAFNLDNISKRFQIDSSFSIRYRVKDEKSGQTSMHTASFIRAIGEKGRQEFLLGINSINFDSLIYERNEALVHENQKLEIINTGIVESVAKIVEARDSGSGDHIVRVKKLTEVIAKEVMENCPEFNLDEERVKLISNASVLHDVGKIVIPDAILLKPGRLTDEEFAIMKTHSERGCDILNVFPLGLDDAFLECALSICRWHHEKYDGKGYPDGLKGDDIPIAAQIVSLADCFDALVSDRPYKKAFQPEKAFEMIKNGECGAFSPKVIDAMEKQKSKLMAMARLYK